MLPTILLMQVQTAVHAVLKASHTSLIEVFNGLNSMPVAFLILVLSNCLISEAALADTLSIEGARRVIAPASTANRQASSINQGLASLDGALMPNPFAISAVKFL